MDIFINASALFFLAIAVFTDLTTQRISNAVVLVGLLCALALHSWLNGWSGVTVWIMGLSVGLLLFLPFYALAGMAAGDVKLMAMVGGFLGANDVFWAAAFSLMAGSVVGLLILCWHKQLLRSLQRYWVIINLRNYIEPALDDAARQRFPYAIAILIGSLLSIGLNISSAGV